LKEEGLFESDILVVATGEDQTNSDIACAAKEQEMEHVIARIERLELRDGLREKGVKVFSSLLSAKSMLRVMIESPDVVDIFTTQENGLFQVDMNNAEYNGVQLRNFPFLGDTIIVRIVRGNESLIPHGDTEIKLNDHLIVTGSREHIDDLRETLN
jgi:CPA2 family monovalent cation:H+ antiporter-2